MADDKYSDTLKSNNTKWIKGLSENRRSFLRICKNCQLGYLVPLAGDGYSEDHCTESCLIEHLNKQNAVLIKQRDCFRKYCQEAIQELYHYNHDLAVHFDDMTSWHEMMAQKEEEENKGDQT